MPVKALLFDDMIPEIERETTGRNLDIGCSRRSGLPFNRKVAVMLKRLFDILVSAVALAIFGLPLAIVCALLRVTGEGQVFFHQKRMGYKNEPFYMTKFATMLKSAATMGSGDYTTENDPRVLPVGRILRKAKINELPQLWDVLRGKMSIVGPRPQLLHTHALYPQSYYRVFDNVRPGITGLGSLVFRDEEKILTDAVDRDYCYKHQIVPYKAELEQWYVDNQTFLLDLRIIFHTIWHVVNPDSLLATKIVPPRLIRSLDTFDGIQAATQQQA